MTLQDEIRQRIKIAMKDKDQIALDALRGLLSACTNEAIALGKTPQDDLSDVEVQSVVKRMIKQRKDSIEQFKAGGRDDLVKAEQSQMAVLEYFQPAQMSDGQIREIAVRIKNDKGINDKDKIGILVGAVMKETAGGADGTLVKQVVESLFE